MTHASFDVAIQKQIQIKQGKTFNALLLICAAMVVKSKKTYHMMCKFVTFETIFRWKYEQSI